MGNDGYLVSYFETPRDRLLLLTIPYEGGWSAYVDGKKSGLLKTEVLLISRTLLLFLQWVKTG